MWRQKEVQWPDLRIGDLFFVRGPGLAFSKHWRGIDKARWWRKLAPDMASRCPEMVLPQAYSEAMSEQGKEPDWAKKLPRCLEQDLRRSWLMGDDFDPLGILPYRRDLGFSFAAQEGGVLEQVMHALHVFRLSYIRQLGFLHDPVAKEVEPFISMRGTAVGSMFPHTRWMHSLTVTATVSLMAYRARLSEREIRHLQVAALTHDVLTPAGGDTVKYVDPAAFDEDAHYSEIFQNNPEWEKVRDRWDLDEALLTATVQGKGLLGHMLDIADKCSYIAHDLDAYLMYTDPRESQFRRVGGLVRMWEFREKVKHPVCALWEKTSVVDGEVVITDARWFADFLMMRAMMFHHLYYNPHSRYREQMICMLTVGPLYEDGLLTRDKLLVMVDWELEQVLFRETGLRDLSFEMARADVAPIVEEFPTLEEAGARARAMLLEQPTTLFMWEEFPPASAKAVQYLVKDSAGRVRPFCEACPQEAEAILELGRHQNPAKLYILPERNVRNVLPEYFWKKLLERQKERLGLVPPSPRVVQRGGWIDGMQLRFDPPMDFSSLLKDL